MTDTVRYGKEARPAVQGPGASVLVSQLLDATMSLEYSEVLYTQTLKESVGPDFV